MKKPLFLLNFSTHQTDMELFHGNWVEVNEFCEAHGMDGIELYPVGELDPGSIPNGLVKGVHLRFFITLGPLICEDPGELRRIFGSLEVAEMFYGGNTKEAVINFYARQLDLAESLGAQYAVFHASEVELDHIYDWAMETPWTRVLEMLCDVLEQALERSRFKGHVLFENLWWPSGFTLSEAGQFEFILSKMNHEKCGIVLDTGHLLIEKGGARTEDQALGLLLQCIHALPAHIKDHIYTVHLTCTLSQGYIETTKKQARSLMISAPDGFWERLSTARKHVMELDRHDPFTLPGASEIIAITQPKYMVFEFRYRDKKSWTEKIETQKKALSIFWP